jgi:glycosyltransferase involved in cell wall biosynthesis
MARTDVSIVVPAFNEEQIIVSSLQSIRDAMTAFEAVGWTCELIVCDNNSTDRTAELARSAGAAVVFEPVNQISRARNTGAAAANGAWLLFVDADSHPSRELFEDMTDVVRAGRCVAGGSTVHVEHPGRIVALVAAFWNRISRLTRWAAGSFVFCEAAAFRQVGGFSLELFAAEEIDLFRKLKRLARRSGRSIQILHRHPLRTSGRKAQLYSPWEAARFALRTLVRRGRTLRSPEECFQWYDGRR